MRIIYEEKREDDPYTGREEYRAGYLRLVCKDEQEFYTAWDKIKSVEGVVWSGCPDESNGEYSDVIVEVVKSPASTIADVKEWIKYYREQVKTALNS